MVLIDKYNKYALSWYVMLCGTLEIVIQEILWSIWGSYSAIWSIPLTNVKWHSDPWPAVTSQPIRLSTNFMTFIQSLTFTDYEWFPWSICNGCGMPAGNAYPSEHLVPSPIVGLACATIVETRFLELAMSLLDVSPRILLDTFSILLATNVTSLCSRNDSQMFTSVILYINIIFIAQWLFGGNSEILHDSDVVARHPKLWNPENFFKQIRVYLFTAKIWRHFSITSQLCLGPFLRGAAHLRMSVFLGLWEMNRSEGQTRRNNMEQFLGDLFVLRSCSFPRNPVSECVLAFNKPINQSECI